MLTKPEHYTRKQEILEKYPEVKKLFGYDPLAKWYVCFLVFFDLIIISSLQTVPWWLFLALAYFIGATIRHILEFSIHELTHGNMFKNLQSNWWFSIFVNLPIGVPVAITFHLLHREHHTHLHLPCKMSTEYPCDADVPISVEKKISNGGIIGKTIWLFFYSMINALRSTYGRPRKQMHPLEVWNYIACFSYDIFILLVFGWSALLYVFVSSIFASGLHPLGGHNITEHYAFPPVEINRKKYETSSYYGALNVISLNVGYHVEHHDFPNIPGRFLPKLRQMAPEFYENRPCHTSWIKAIWVFITSPEMGSNSRFQRHDDDVKKL